MDHVLRSEASCQWLSISSFGDSPGDLARIRAGQNPVLLQAAWASVFRVSPREVLPSSFGTAGLGHSPAVHSTADLTVHCSHCEQQLCSQLDSLTTLTALGVHLPGAFRRVGWSEQWAFC